MHGSLQAERLGRFFTKRGLLFSHVYSSDLQRASKTASAICTWNDAAGENKLQMIVKDVLREQDFGFYEGKPFYARPRDSHKSGKENHRSQYQDDPDFQDVESKESMDSRMNNFLADDLLPLLFDEQKEEKIIAVVSHGIILSHLWRCFLKVLPKNSVTLTPGLSVGKGGVTTLEYLGGWSNTGYLELDIRRKSLAAIEPAKSKSSLEPPISQSIHKDSLPKLHNYKVTVKTVNGKEHLQGLKRTKGGVGSSKFDEGQKSIESFFKKQKVG